MAIEDEKIRTWLSNLLSEMRIGGVWMPENAGVTYQKTEEKKLTLVRLVDTDECREYHERMRTIILDLGYKILDSEAELVPEHTNQMEVKMQESDMKRRIAQGWVDEDGTPLIDMNLDSTYPRFVQENEVLLDNGETIIVDVWEYPLYNPNTGKTLSITPDDYHLLVGDDIYMQYKNKIGYLIRALDRDEIERIDFETVNIGIADPFTKEKVPPWMFGTICEVIRSSKNL